MKTFVTSALVALSLLSAGVAVTSSASAAEFGSRQWWSEQQTGG
jgi:hypothetical protein